MRIGLIADIHANLVALETVLAELAEEALDDRICLGDVAALGPQPGAVLVRLCTLGCPVVMGNMDAWLLAPPADGAADEFGGRVDESKALPKSHESARQRSRLQRIVSA